MRGRWCFFEFPSSRWSALLEGQYCESPQTSAVTRPPEQVLGAAECPHRNRRHSRRPVIRSQRTNGQAGNQVEAVLKKRLQEPMRIELVVFNLCVPDEYRPASFVERSEGSREVQTREMAKTVVDPTRRKEVEEDATLCGRDAVQRRGEVSKGAHGVDRRETRHHQVERPAPQFRVNPSNVSLHELDVEASLGGTLSRQTQHSG